MSFCAEGSTFCSQGRSILILLLLLLLLLIIILSSRPLLERAERDVCASLLTRRVSGLFLLILILILVLILLPFLILILVFLVLTRELLRRPILSSDHRSLG